MRGFEDLPVDWAPASVWIDDHNDRHQTVQFIVPGRPVPKGNLIKGRYGGYHDPTKGLDEWLAAVRSQAQAAMTGQYRERHIDSRSNCSGFGSAVVTLPLFWDVVMVDVTFVLKRPKATPKTKTPPAVKKPDVDKLARAVLDAITGIVYNDDSQVVELHARKRLAYLDETPGAIIKITSNVKVE